MNKDKLIAIIRDAEFALNIIAKDLEEFKDSYGKAQVNLVLADVGDVVVEMNNKVMLLKQEEVLHE